MKKVIAALLLIGGLSVAAAPAAQATGVHLPKVTICHATGSATNPYVRINVSVNALQGHGTLLNVAAFLQAADLVDVTAHFSFDEGHENDIIIKDSDNDAECPGPVGPPGEQGPPGEDGEDGEDGQTPTILCFPGVGLGYTFNPEAQLPDGSFILGDGAICPLAGEDGADGTNGVNGKDGASGVAGAVGPAGPAGAVTETAPVTTTTTAAPVAAPTGDLPRTGSNGTLALVLGGFSLLFLGGAVRYFTSYGRIN